MRNLSYGIKYGIDDWYEDCPTAWMSRAIGWYWSSVELPISLLLVTLCFRAYCWSFFNPNVDLFSTCRPNTKKSSHGRSPKKVRYTYVRFYTVFVIYNPCSQCLSYHMQIELFFMKCTVMVALVKYQIIRLLGHFETTRMCTKEIRSVLMRSDLNALLFHKWHLFLQKGA